MAGRKRSEGFAFFMPVVGFLLIMPPLVMLFDVKANFFGVPLIVAYLFGTWMALIVASFILRRTLPQSSSDGLPSSDDEDAGV